MTMKTVERRDWRDEIGEKRLEIIKHDENQHYKEND